VFGRETKKERLAFQIGIGVLLAAIWIVTLLGILEFSVTLFGLLLIFTVVYILSLVKKADKGVASDTNSKTGPDRYGKSY